jgi:hypothetical protein
MIGRGVRLIVGWLSMRLARAFIALAGLFIFHWRLITWCRSFSL